MAFEIAILGSVEPRVNGKVVGVPTGKQRALLTLLAVRAPYPVSAGSAAESLWPRAAPGEAMRSLQVTVSRLRRSLGAAGSALETVASGYRLAVEEDAIDARRFETLIDEARAARVGSDAVAARRLLDDALGLWRGPALADVGFESFAQTEIARLEELRVAALEERIDTRLSEGEHALVVAELEQLSAEHPSRERLVGLLMLALYRCGRQTDALEVYTRGRRRLDEEIGLEPSPELQRLQEAILRHDPSLEALGRGGREPTHGPIDERQPPEGVVTMLFTDIEGSTRSARAAGSLWPQLLAEHHALVLDAVEGAGGYVDGSEGDALFAYFVDPSAAVEAAVGALRGLRAHAWPADVGELRVRMGLHVGYVERAATGYVGLEVHRAARICAVGHGGQILLSNATRELLDDDLAPGVSFRDLGEWRLKDFDRPEHLFQVVVGDLPADFPPPVSVAVSPGGADGDLPPLPNRTVGREGDVRAIAERLRVFNGRLVTLTGPGGVGKTRLAVEIGRAVQADFADGVRFVSLAAVRRAQDAPSAIVRALAIVSVSGETSEQTLTRFLAVKDLLLVLDNVEHVLPAASQFVSDLLSACSTLTVLATSREALALHAEERYPVAPLALPEPGRSEDPETLAGIDAVALFCERARAHDPDFRLGAGNAAAVAEICRRVDGLPLAIELAAARCGLLSASEIAERLDAALGALGGGPRDAPARQRTLRATIDWSHDLLSAAEKQCFARFAVCAGGATVQAAETITATGLDTLDGLVAKSLLVRRRHTPRPTRLGMLETIRAYATERFATAPDNEAVCERHYRYFLVLAQRHATERALWGADGEEHLARLDAENDNLHAALRWAVGQANAERALAITAPLGSYWFMRDRYADAVEWIDRALSLPGADMHPALRVRALRIKVRCLGPWRLGRSAEQPAAMVEAETIARQSGDPAILSQALQTRADLAAKVGRLDAADALADEALRCAEAADDEWEIASSFDAKAMAASTIAELRERVDRAATLLDDAGNVWQLAGLLGDAAYLALEVGSDHDAKQFLHRMLPIARKLAHPYLWMMFRGNFGLAALLTGDSDAARHAFREELRLSSEAVLRPLASEGLLGLAAVATVRGNTYRAARLRGAAAAYDSSGIHDAAAAHHSSRIYDRLDTEFFEPARTRHGADAWDAAVRDGGTLSFEDAIAYALQEPRT